MKLARITHERCQEWSGYLHVMIPDDWEYEKFYDVVYNCVNEHVAAAKLYSDNSIPPNAYKPYNGINYKEFDTSMTIGEANLEWGRMKEEYEAWKKTLDPTTKSFSARLQEHGVRMLYDMQGGYMDDPADGDEILETSAGWGHNHGLSFRYEEDQLQDMLPPGKKRRDYASH